MCPSAKIANASYNSARKKVLRRPGETLEGLVQRGLVEVETADDSASVELSSVETLVKYEGYLRRQKAAVSRSLQDERRRIPDGFPDRR